MAQRVESPPAVQEAQARSLGWEDALEKEMAICSNILGWRIPWTEEPDGPQSMESSVGSEAISHEKPDLCLLPV